MLSDSLWADSGQEREQLSTRALVLILLEIEAQFQGGKLPCGTKEKVTKYGSD